MTRKIKLFGRKKLILSLYNELDEKEEKLQKLFNENIILKKENDDLKNKTIIYKTNNMIANDFQTNSFLKQEIINNKSFLEFYKKIFTNLELLSTKEYKSFVELLLFDKNNVYPKELKNSIIKEYIRQCLKQYNRDFYRIPIYFNDHEYNDFKKELYNLISIDSLNTKKIINENSKNKTFQTNIGNFSSNYNREINLINNINEITEDQIIYFKDKILSLVSELIIFLIIENNDSISNYFELMNKFLKDFDYKGFDDWQKTTSNPISIKTFMKTLIKIQWLSLNKKINNSECAFYLEYPNNYNLFLSNFGKVYDKSNFVTKKNVIVKGTNKNLVLYKTNEYYTWLIDDNKKEKWFDNIYLSNQEINYILNTENSSVIKAYGIDFDLSSSMNIDIVDVVENKQINPKLLLIDNQFLLEKIFFYFIYINRHK